MEASSARPSRRACYRERRLNNSVTRDFSDVAFLGYRLRRLADKLARYQNCRNNWPCPYGYAHTEPSKDDVPHLGCDISEFDPVDIYAMLKWR